MRGAEYRVHNELSSGLLALPTTLSLSPWQRVDLLCGFRDSRQPVWGIPQPARWPGVRRLASSIPGPQKGIRFWVCPLFVELVLHVLVDSTGSATILEGLIPEKNNAEPPVWALFLRVPFSRLA